MQRLASSVGACSFHLTLAPLPLTVLCSAYRHHTIHHANEITVSRLCCWTEGPVGCSKRPYETQHHQFVCIFISNCIIVMCMIVVIHCHCLIDRMYSNAIAGCI